jgi:hypothetical protein
MKQGIENFKNSAPSLRSSARNFCLLPCLSPLPSPEKAPAQGPAPATSEIGGYLPARNCSSSGKSAAGNW